jgi:hypothetical protein
MAHSSLSANGALLLADISGYTSFLQDVATAHRDDAFAGGRIPEAYALMSSLLDGIVEAVEPPFTLAKLEGDAVFAFGAAAEVPHGTRMLDCVRACYAGFRERLGQAGLIWTCSCDACSRASNLELKFILHAGSYVVQAIAGRRELMGPDVVLAHRLLKSEASSVMTAGAYILITEAAASMLEVPVGGAATITETYDHYAPITASLIALDRFT